MPSIPAGGLVAVTGANGFIGAHVCLALLDAGYAVRAVVRDPTDQDKTEFLTKAAAGNAGRLSFAAGSLMEPGSYDGAFSGCAAVVHTAAVVDVSSSGDKQKTVVDPSVLGTKNVLASIAKAGTVKRYVHTSSCISVQSLEKPEGHVFTEIDFNSWSTIENGDAYGFAKVSAENVVWEAARAEGCSFDAVCINPGVVLGPVLTKAHTKASVVLLRQIVYGNALQNYNCTFVDVRDVAKAHALALSVEDAGAKRFLLVANEGPMNTCDLGPLAQAAFPDLVLNTVPAFPSWKWSLVKLMWVIGMGPSAFEVQMMERKIRFDGAQAKGVLGLEVLPLADTVKASLEAMFQFITPRKK